MKNVRVRIVMGLSCMVFALAVCGWHCSPVRINAEGFANDSGEEPPDADITTPSCKSDDSCEPWEACRDGACVHICTEDLDCFAGRRCSRDGVCVETGADGGHGDADIPDGVGGECNSGLKEPCYTGPQGTKEIGICKSGTKTCINGYWGKCEGSTTPQKELCDALDNDCDGEVDEDCQSCKPTDLQKLDPGHLSSISHVAFDPSGTLYATASQDQSVKVWSVATNALVHDLMVQNNTPARIAFLPDGKSLIVLYSNNKITRWDMTSGKASASATLTRVNNRSLHISSDGKWLVTSSYSNEVQRWDTKDFKQIELIPTTVQPQHIALSPDDTRIAISQNNTGVQILEIGKKTTVTTPKVTSSLRGLAFSTDGKALIGMDYAYLYKWNVVDGKEIAKHKLSRYALSIIAHPDGKHVVIPGYNGEVYTYALDTGKQTAFWRSVDRSITGVALSADGKALLIGTSQGKVQIAQTSDGKLLHTIEPLTYVETNAVAYHPQGTHFALVSQRTTIQVWDSNSLEVKHSFKTAAEVKGLTFSPDGKTLYAGLFAEKNTIIRAWDWATEKQLYDEKKELGVVHTIAIAPDGKHLYTASEGNTVDEWDASSGKHLRSLRGHTGPVYSIAVTNDSKELLTASWDNNIKRWDLASGDPIEGFTGHTTELNAIAISPDGKRFASGDSKGLIIIWELSSSKEVHKLRGHFGGITSLRFSNDGGTLLSSALDGTLRLWSTSTGAPKVTIIAHKQGALAATFAPNGKDILSGGGSGTRLWKCP